ncbi:MAG: AAA family ATPase [Planctomycetaceae bacterium]|jgi:AAA15 family ATPase/GTPase|nr:AAA family ATPase [Planctomycetaceae bacterium]
MLNSLYIKNYRNIKELKINSLEQINLLSGKNNTGKSSLLEAVSIYANGASLDCIFQLLKKRGEYFKRDETNNDNPVEENLRLFSSIFTDRIIGYDETSSIQIKDIIIGFTRYNYDERQKYEEEERRRRNYFENFGNNLGEAACKIGLEINSSLFPLERDYRQGMDVCKKRNEDNSYKIQFVETKNLERNINGTLFDSIVLTEKEKYVIDALKLIEPDTERIAFVENNEAYRSDRYAVIKLSNTTDTLPLKSMGDGINHILTIILALVNVENGFLLIDEFENGLHYTVQEQLWKIIFKLAKELNVQVFATTHSRDSISSFAQALNHSENSTKGKLIRLDNINGEIQPIEYSRDELLIADKHNIETR